MITTVITAVTTTTTTTTTTAAAATTTTAAAATTTAAVGAHIVGIGIFAIVVLVLLLILRDISMVELENGKESKKNPFLSSFVNSSSAFIIPLVYVFTSIILYKIIAVI